MEKEQDSTSSTSTEYKFRLEDGQSAADYLKGLFSNLCQPSTSGDFVPNRKPTIADLTAEFNKLQQEYNEAEIVHDETLKSVEGLQRELDEINAKIEEKQKRDKALLKEKTMLTQEYNLLQKSKDSKKDQEAVQLAELKYKCLRNMTQVKFTFNKLEDDTLEGTVFNQVHNVIKRFSIGGVSKKSPEQIRDHILTVIEESTDEHHIDNIKSEMLE